MWFFIVIIFIDGVLTWSSLVSIFPVLALTIGTMAYWQTNPKYVRYISATIKTDLDTI
ncbi:MAG: YgjV family protein [Candidatus Woesearchaeota archaeon]